MNDPDGKPTMVVRLDEGTIDRLAHRVAEILRVADPKTPADQAQRTSPAQMLSAAQVADSWQIDREWVYAHADELGAMRLGTGPRPRLRFDPETVRLRLEQARTPTAPARPEQNRRGSPPIPSDPGELLPFRADPELSSKRPKRRSAERPRRAADQGPQDPRSTR